jgi:CRISPR-associated protein Cmr2
VGILAESARQVLDERETRVPGLAEPPRDPGRWFARSGGPWVYPGRWQVDSLARETKNDLDAIKPSVSRGADAARHLVKLMRERQVPEPAGYLAVIVQDVDSMGKFLSGKGTDRSGRPLAVDVIEHRRISEVLRAAAGGQRRELEASDLLGVPVYAGGDDLLAFVPAARALDAARACHELIPPDLPWASTAVLFFHYHSGIQSAMTMARDLLKAAKAEVPGKHALAVGYRRRSGASEATIQPWAADDGSTAMDRLGVFGLGREYRLSPRLAGDLERDSAELGGLHRRDRELYQAELTRLVRRHLASDPENSMPAGGSISGGQAAREVARALAWLGDHEHTSRRSGEGAGPRPVRAARVGVFVRQEAR